MGLSSALFASVAGLDTTSTAISVIGDNIANVNTPGFKSRRAEFSDVLGQTINGVAGSSPLGQGAKLSQISTVYAQGAFETTGRPEDLAIEGQGFFVIEDPDGTSYTRSGIFGFNDLGVLTDPNGGNVQGFAIDPVTGLSTGQRGDITRSNALAPPQVTSSIEISANLAPSSPPVFQAFDPVNPGTTSTLTAPVTVYDSLGNQRAANVWFSETGVGTWDWNVTLPAGDTTLAPVPGANEVVQGSGTLTFDNTGVLTNATGTAVTFEFAGGAAPSAPIDIGFGPIAGAGTGSPTTAFGANQPELNSFSQDGFGAGTLSSINIGTDGVLTGQFSNGETLPLYQLALATFPNIEGLQTVGNGRLKETRDSGQPLVGAPESGTLGSIKSGNLEQSTVDLAAEFVRLIINQRAFQANTRTISTTNELLGNLVALGQ